MVYRANVLSVMIASPSDVIEQRDDVRTIINNWNFAHSYSNKIILMPVGWETHAAPDLAGRAQDIINDRLLTDCDLLVGIFWTKLGTPTGNFESGTVEEISKHIDMGKPAMVYFSDSPVAPSTLDSQSYTNVQSFKRWCYDKGLVNTFQNSMDFRDQFSHHLQIQINSNPYLGAVLENSNKSDKLSTVAAEMSPEAEKMLLAAADDHQGYIMTFSTMEGRHIQIGREHFGEPNNARSTALWESGLEELINLRYVKPRGAKGESFQITNSGYLRAENIKDKIV